jgi:uncharacterized protein (DUF2164 family)
MAESAVMNKNEARQRRASRKLTGRPLSSLATPEVTMSIELQKEARQEAIVSIERYFREERDEKIGNIAAAALLNYFLEEIGPSIYNQAVADMQERMQMRVSELDIEIHEDEFAYWPRHEKQRKPR